MKLNFDPLDGTPIVNGKALELSGYTGGAPMYGGDGFFVIVSHVHPDESSSGRVDVYFQMHNESEKLFVELGSEGLYNLEQFARSYGAELRLHGSGPGERPVSLLLDEDVVRGMQASDVTVTEDYGFKVGASSPVAFYGGDQLGLSLSKDEITVAISGLLQRGHDSAGKEDEVDPATVEGIIEGMFERNFEVQGPAVKPSLIPMGPSIEL